MTAENLVRMKNGKPFGVVERNFECGKYHCLVVFTRNGVYNGYIGVPKGHFLYKQPYGKRNERLKFDKDKAFNNNVFGFFEELLTGDKQRECLAPDLYFSAHCGFNYSGALPGYKEAKRGYWYFGFDCGHCADGRDFEKAYKLGLLEEYEYFVLRDVYDYFDFGEFRTADYVEENLRQVAAEMQELDKEDEKK